MMPGRFSNVEPATFRVQCRRIDTMNAANPDGRGPEPAVPQFTIGDRLRKAREFSGMDMNDLAAAIDIHRQTIARYESGVARPKRYVLLSWSVATGVDLAWIQGPDNAAQQTATSTDSESSAIKGSETRGKTRVTMSWTAGK